MNTHEYQAKIILGKYGIPVPRFAVASNLKEVEEAMNFLGLQKAVLKVQVHAGGRGKAGGVKFANEREEILTMSKQLLGMKFVNNQTGPEGVVVQQILLSDPVAIQKEFYLSVFIDREKAQAVLIASPEGGVDIEEVAKKYPDRILTLPIGLQGTLKSYQLLRLAKFMKWEGNVLNEGKKIAIALVKIFFEKDASLLEINPLVLTPQNELFAIDAKLSIDENALYRQQEIANLFDATQLSMLDAKAREHELAYISLGGEIGCMVNGAGLAMATMDIIHHYGGHPANFLDVGGGASQEKVAEGFKLILEDEKVKALLVNIFGGIMNCETLAAGIISAANQLKIHVPLVVRLEGTNVDKGRKMLKESGLNIISAESLSEAAQKAVQALKR